MNNNIEKKVINFGKPLAKKDIKRFLSFLSEKVSYEMNNIGNVVGGVDIPIQNECSGAITCEEIKIPYCVHIHGENVYRLQLSCPPVGDKEILNNMERKVTEFFLAYP